MDKNLRNTHVRFKSYFKTSLISYLNNIGGQVIPFTNNFNFKARSAEQNTAAYNLLFSFLLL